MDPLSKKKGNYPQLLSLLLLIVLSLPSVTHQSKSPTIYDYLRDNGLPPGILPQGISEFSFNETTGEFQINLTQSCNAKFENELHYDFNITGSLSYGKMGKLSGMTQQDLFSWFPVKGIRVDVPSSGLIYFDVGVVGKQFSLSLFEIAPDCTAADPGDGVDFQYSKTNNGSVVETEELVPLVGQGKFEMVLDESRRRLGGFQICALCTCCGGARGVCVPSPCCYAINCNIPHRPYGFCSFTPKTCNCFGCHI